MSMTEMLRWITWIEYVGSIAFAASGALIGIKKHMDLFGVMVLGLTTATAGGVLRDLILGVSPPMMFKNPIYAIIAMITALIIFLKPVRNLLHTDSKAYDRVMFFADTLGLAIFVVVGVRNARAAMPTAGVFLQVFTGVVSAVGGGVLRDVMAQEMPYIFTKHIYAVACVIGALVCVLLWPLGNVVAMAVGFAVVFAIRCLSSHFKWNLPKA